MKCVHRVVPAVTDEPEDMTVEWTADAEDGDEWTDEDDGVETTTRIEDDEIRYCAEQQCGPENEQFELWILADANGNKGGERCIGTFEEPIAAEDSRDARVSGMANARPSDYEIRVTDAAPE